MREYNHGEDQRYEARLDGVMDGDRPDPYARAKRELRESEERRLEHIGGLCFPILIDMGENLPSR